MSETISWTPEMEIVFFHGMEQFKPTGMHKYFRMWNLFRYFNKNSPEPVARTQDLWDKVNEYYDISVLDEMEDEEFGGSSGLIEDGLVTFNEFVLPKSWIARFKPELLPNASLDHLEIGTSHEHHSTAQSHPHSPAEVLIDDDDNTSRTFDGSVHSEEISPSSVVESDSKPRRSRKKKTGEISTPTPLRSKSGRKTLRGKAGANSIHQSLSSTPKPTSSSSPSDSHQGAATTGKRKRVTRNTLSESPSDLVATPTPSSKKRRTAALSAD